MSSSKYSKKTNISTFDFKINNTHLYRVKVFKDLEVFNFENLKSNHHISYLFWIASTTSFQVLNQRI